VRSTSTIREQRQQLKRLVSRQWNVMAQPGLCQDFQGRTDLAAHAWKALFAAHIARHDAIVLKLWSKVASGGLSGDVVRRRAAPMP
jgi:hypothetical protein